MIAYYWSYAEFYSVLFALCCELLKATFVGPLFYLHLLIGKVCIPHWRKEKKLNGLIDIRLTLSQVVGYADKDCRFRWSRFQ